MTDIKRAAQFFGQVSKRQGRNDVAERLLAGEDPDVVRKGKNLSPWVDAVLIGSGEPVPMVSPTYQRRVIRALRDFLELREELPEDIQRHVALGLREVMIQSGFQQSDLDIVYAFRTEARQGIRIGQSTIGWRRVRAHVLVYQNVTPVWVCASSTPKASETLILDDLSPFRDDFDQDWHLGVSSDDVLRVALNHGLVLSIHEADIWTKAGVTEHGLASA